MQLNENIKMLPERSLTVKRRIADFVEKNPSATLIRLDQNLMNVPLPQVVIEGMRQAVDEVSVPYGARLSSPWSGYAGLKSTVALRLRGLGAAISESEIFITSGLESSYSCLSALFSSENNVLLIDPCDQRLPQLHQASGRTVSFLRATPENNFLPEPDGEGADLICLASPNPVTGAAMDRNLLKRWVDFANEHGSILFFDASLSEYLPDDENYPRSIYEIPGAKNCAVELFSFEKGYGVRELKIAYLVIPQTLVRNQTRLGALFSIRQPVTATPPSFVMQKAAELLLSPEAAPDTKKLLGQIKSVAKTLSNGLNRVGIPNTGSNFSPYLWVQCPWGMNSWQCFDMILEKAQCVVTPGSLFGYGGERFFRITSFGLPEEAQEAVEKLGEIFSQSPPKENENEEEKRTAQFLFGE